MALRRARSGRCGSVRVKAVPAPPPRPGAGTAPLVAFALPRRVGGAVVRNRIRRRLRVVLTDLARSDGAERPDPALRADRAYLVSADAEAASCPFPTLQGWVAEAVRRAHASRGGGRA
jgi:RNase P protein component